MMGVTGDLPATLITDTGNWAFVDSYNLDRGGQQYLDGLDDSLTES